MENELIRILPKPTRVDVKEGYAFVTASAIVVAEHAYLKEDFSRFAEGLLCSGESAEITYALRSDRDLEDEGYRLTIGDRVDVVATSYAGLVYGWQTLKQLLVQFEKNGTARIPNCVITDKPRFAYRGFMLDICRHWFDKEIILRQIDLAVLHKLNVFHLHLSEDQGIRFESERYPRLNEVGSFRKRNGHDGVAAFGKEKATYGGYLTKADIAEIVAYGQERAMEIVPEIDVPGHCMGMIAAYPELSCKGEKIEVANTFGVKKTILCAGNDNTIEFVKNLLTEVAEMFPSPWFHIGGDEAPKGEWKACPKCQKRIADEGLKDEEALQGYFTNVVVEHLKTLGKTAIVWNEAINSGILDKQVVCQFWQDKKGGDEVAKQANAGRKTVVSPFFAYYLDYPYGMTSLRKTYRADPLIKGLSEQGKKSVVGVETPLWTEWVSTLARADYLTFPRLCAVAETGWSTGEKNYEEFESRLAEFLHVLDLYKVTYAPLEDVNPNCFAGLKQVAAFMKNAAKYVGKS